MAVDKGERKVFELNLVKLCPEFESNPQWLGQYTDRKKDKSRIQGPWRAWQCACLPTVKCEFYSELRSCRVGR